MPVVPLQIYPQFDIQISYKNVYEAHCNWIICKGEIKFVKKCTHTNGAV
jgi:hypothetical protein